MVFEVVVGLQGAWAGAYHDGGEAELAGVYGADGVRRDDEAGDVGEGEVDAEKEEECGVVVAVGADVIVYQKQEEDGHDTDEGGEEGVEQLGEACTPQYVAVGALYGVERQPSCRHEDEPEPEVAVVEYVGHVAEAGVFERHLAEEE